MKPKNPSASLPAFALAAALAASVAVCYGLAPTAHADDSRRRADSDLRGGLSLRLSPGELCADLLEGSEPRLELPPVESILSYLSQLNEGLLPADQFGTKELERMESALESEGELRSPWSGKPLSSLTSAQLIHQGALEQLLHEFETLSEQEQQEGKKTLLARIKEMLAKREHVSVRREETRKETESPFRKEIFHPIPPGKFEMGEAGSRAPVELTHEVEWMETDVTQFMWASEMGENPSHFQDGEDAVTIEIDGRQIRMQPDHPVESITWWSAVEYLNRRSKKEKFEPAYDLSEITWRDGTSAAAGTLVPASDEEEMKLKINAPDGDIYQTQGFRLPTDAEWEYVYRNLGKAKGEYPHDISEKELPDHAWHVVNSNRKTHAVGTTAKSFRVNGKVFHDLIGNVWKWTHDGWSDSLKGGVNPQGPQTPSWGSGRVLRGGSWNYDPRFLLSARRGGYSRGIRYGGVGFRSMRTLR